MHTLYDIAQHDDKFADNLAFEHLSLICDGPCLTLYQQLVMSGRIDWCANVVNAENMSNPGADRLLIRSRYFLLLRRIKTNDIVHVRKNTRLRTKVAESETSCMC